MVLVALLIATAILLMHGVTDRWSPDPSVTVGLGHHAADVIALGSSSAGDFVSHHDLERCVPCGVAIALTIGLLVTVFRAPPPENLAAVTSRRVMALDLSPPDHIELCVVLR